jgi:hypothetical protein
MTLLMDLLYALAVCLGWPYLLYRRLTRGPSGVPLREYFGRVPSRPVSAHCVWIHAVSLGEINATRTIVAELRRRTPGTIVAISSTTKTGLARARELYPRHVVFRYPLDFSFVIRNLLNRIRPSVIVLLELETWPNLVEVATQQGIPVLIFLQPADALEDARLHGHRHERPGDHRAREPAPAQSPALSLGQPGASQEDSAERRKLTVRCHERFASASL